MNWKDAETDAWLKQGRSALTEADRAKYYALVQQKVMREHLWMPVLNINMDQVANKKITGARPHMIYQNTFYKGLDVTRLKITREEKHDAQHFDGRCGAARSGRHLLGGRGADPEDDEVAGRAALRRPAHDLVADVRYRQHVPGYAGGASTGTARRAIPYLAKSWTISEDGKTYTFKLRDDVHVLQRQEVHRRRRDLLLQAPEGSRTKAPLAWRAGNIKELRAPDPYTVEYELNEPFSDLLLQLTMFTTAIHNQESVEALGKDYGIKGIDGTGPWCFESWQPRTEIVLKRHDAYKWGPSMYQNKGPVKFEKLSIKIVPEDSSRVAAMLGGQFDVTHQIPLQFIQQVKAAPNLNVQEALPNFQLMYYGYKTTRPMVADVRVREAMNIAINRADIVKGIMLGNAEPAYTFIDPKALDFAESTKGIIKEDAERAKKLLDEAGWKVGSDGIREKDGMKLAPRVLYTQVAYFPRVSEAIQGYMRKIGIDWKIIGFDSTIAPAEMGKQDYELWTVTFPYISAGDLMNFYFDSKNMPTPNRMNWNDAETDEYLQAGPRRADRRRSRANTTRWCSRGSPSEHLWMPVMNIAMYTTSSKKLKGVRPHMLYQNTFYKGLDYSF